MTEATAIKKIKKIIKGTKFDEGKLRVIIRHIFIDMNKE